MPDTPADHHLWMQLSRPLTPAEMDMPRTSQAPAGDAAASARLVLRYQPIWNVQQRAIGIHCAEPVPAAGQHWADGRGCGEIDRQILCQVLADAGGRHDVGSICLPVQFAGLATASPRNALLGACEAIPAGLRDLLVWEITGLPETVGETQLFSVVSAIQPYGRAIFLQRELEQAEFDVLAAIGIHSVGTDLRRAAGSETLCAGRLERFAERAHTLGLRCHVHGLASRSLSLTAIGAGFDYLAGPAIAGTVDMPWAVIPYDVESLLLRNVISAGAAPVGG